MATKITIVTTQTNPLARGDLFLEPYKCFKDFANEVVTVNGWRGLDIHRVDSPQVWVFREWPDEFNWPLIGDQFQRGYEVASGDWVIRMDLDMLFHEQDYLKIREAIRINEHAPALSFWKYQFIRPDRYNLKSRLVIAVNKGRYGHRIKFNGGGDLCQPTLDGKLIKPLEVPEARVPIYNYECLIKTKEQILKDKGRMARAWQRHFNEYKLGGPDDWSAYKKWLEMLVGRASKPQEVISIEAHPKVMQQTLKDLKPKHFGYNGFGAFERTQYV